jgi:adenine-specific DNA-methyltransferase
MAKRPANRRGATAKRIDQALKILASLNVPREQQNERSALVLLALLGMTPSKPWEAAAEPMLGITEMMNVFRDQFGKEYAPNTRETVRRFTVHQFVQMGLVVANPDDPRRPVNSPATRYQIAPTLLKLARTFGSPAWAASLAAYVAAAGALGRLQARERDMALVAVKLPNGKKVPLTAGGQNELVQRIIEDFCPRFTPNAVELTVHQPLGFIELPFVDGFFGDARW